MLKTEFNSIYSQLGENTPLIIKTEDGKIYKGIIKEFLDSSGAVILDESVPFGSQFVIKYQDMVNVEKDNNAFERLYIGGMTI